VWRRTTLTILRRIIICNNRASGRDLEMRRILGGCRIGRTVSGKIYLAVGRSSLLVGSPCGEEGDVRREKSADVPRDSRLTPRNGLQRGDIRHAGCKPDEIESQL
jgi:hypothetical protein